MAMGLSLSQELEFISNTLDELRFAGTDQNPKGIRDLLGACISDAKRLEAAKHVNSLGGYYAPDGTLMNANGTRSIFDDVDK